MTYVCSKCWYKTITRLWKCPECWQFWTFVEEFVDNSWSWKLLIENINLKKDFYTLQNTELKRVFTKWIKVAWVYLLWWQPWIGKSTLVLQIVKSLKDNLSIWYFSWEEEAGAIFSRYKRIYQKVPNFKVYHSTCLEDILKTVEHENISLFVVDSIQTIYSNQITWIAGSVNQVKYCAEKISEFCKKKLVSCIIIWHITKTWEIAWPKYLEHIVDVVAYLEGDRLNDYRFLRTQKNRFWSTDDVAIFYMTEVWLQPVYDLKDQIKKTYENIPGSVLSVGIDNWRPILINLEVLLNKTKYKFPKRTALGIDNFRLEMIIAVLERYLKINFWFMDIFINIPWEFKFSDAWLDLSVAVAILSAYYNKSVNKDKVFIWEILLSGKINKSKFHTKRVKEIQNFDIIDYQKIKNIQELKMESWLFNYS